MWLAPGLLPVPGGSRKFPAGVVEDLAGWTKRVETTRACATPAPLYRVELLDPWFETQNGLVALNDMPHGFLRLGSRFAASPGTSEARLVW